ncbi:MAG: hypothetical protein VST71_06550 [Nitrospirota bacterium]|nr:hypothetical protein [Nitrospirota bacterium]
MDIFPKRKNTIGYNVSVLLSSLHELLIERVNTGSPPKTEKKQYSKKLQICFELCNVTRGWNIENKDLCIKGAFLAELWTNRNNPEEKVVVVFEKNSNHGKGCFPVFHMPVTTEKEAESLAESAVDNLVTEGLEELAA